MNADTEALWRIIETGLRAMDNAVDREKARKVLVRRLRHWGVIDAGLTPIRPPGGFGPYAMPTLDSPLCQCGDQRRSHDEDGSCRVCICPQYANEDSHV